MQIYNYKNIYDLQDKVFDIVFSFNNSFYLTGGTCLSRFYWEKRYSDDLDFFTDSTSLFGINVREILNALRQRNDIENIVEFRDFIRIKVNSILQIDFVNDRVPRYKEIIILKNNYRIDNVENILCNKITAVLGRDNPKDIFDIYLIARFHEFTWSDILLASRKKMHFNNEDLVFRLKTFPVNLLENLKLFDENFMSSFSNDFKVLIEDVINEGKNRLVKEVPPLYRNFSDKT